MRRIIAVAGVCLVLLAGCSGSGSDKTDGPKETLPSNTTTAPGSDTKETTTSTTQAETTTTEAEAETTTTVAEAKSGSKASPLDVGQGAVVGEWEVTVTQIVPNATAEVQGANEFNEPPAKGQYMKVVLDTTYKGAEEGQPDFALAITLSGTDAVQYKTFDCSASFGSDEFSTLEPGGKATLSDCIDAPAPAIAGGTIFVEDQAEFDGNSRTYWKVP